MLFTNLFNVLSSKKRKQENNRIAYDARFNKILSIANEFSAYTSEKIQEKIMITEMELLNAPFWRRAEKQILTEALYRAQNLINNRARLYQKQRMITRPPLVLLKNKAA